MIFFYRVLLYFTYIAYTMNHHYNTESLLSDIGAGKSNEINTTSSAYSIVSSSIVGGTSNCITPDISAIEHSVIAGGFRNVVRASYSSILGGYNNLVTGQCSAILGGSGNNDNGLSYVGIFGCNINNPLNMSANTFHVNCLNAVDTPPWSGSFPLGSITWKDCTSITSFDKVLVIL